MSVTGLCGICERAEARYQCDRCATHVCENHYQHATDRCINCAQELDPGGFGSDDFGMR